MLRLHPETARTILTELALGLVVLDADAGEWFMENGGLTRENGQFFREQVLSKGNSVDAMEGYLSFRGKDPDIAPLLRRRRLG